MMIREGWVVEDERDESLTSNDDKGGMDCGGREG